MSLEARIAAGCALALARLEAASSATEAQLAEARALAAQGAVVPLARILAGVERQPLGPVLRALHGAGRGLQDSSEGSKVPGGPRPKEGA